MPKSITHDIEVKVSPFFEESNSSPINQAFIFRYHVNIENNSNDAVQLLSRHWYIFDSNGSYKEVKGEGVIGQQPIIRSGMSHEYESYSKLTTDIGMMWGTYLMRRVKDKKLFEVKIPEFQLIVPARLN
ncbi:MAG: Co2+/Mg2+ efflux protein ApaG [Verrucomicrobia bacterium]|nr:Co2+/Mg2+ efflux protein ApaG [Verrucomicrobiota bacterium]|tara:strand:+ start:226 stop:612 length:387 start_codon:yes stop_codon:yes gene_type:complete